MNKKLVAIRGAVCCENSKESITEFVCKMCNEIFEKNNLQKDDLVSIQFTATKEITALNPATALRIGMSNVDCSETALFCCQEPEIDGAMKNVIRVMVTAYKDVFSTKKNIYLNGAEKLRPDFNK